MEHHVKQTPVQGVTGLWGGSQGALMAGGGADPVYVDDVYSTFLYRGTQNTAKTITNNLDLSTDGGMVVIRAREANSEWCVNDTVNGAGKSAQWQSSGGFGTSDESVYSYTTSGFTLPSAWAPMVNTNKSYLSYSFKKESKFLDIISYSGNGVSTGRAINHSLGAVPGFMIVKRTDSSSWGQWWIYHRSLPDGKALYLNGNDGQQGDGNNYWGTGSSFVHPTATQLTIGEYPNQNGGSYVGYIFGHNEDAFGPDSDQPITYAGSYTGNGSTDGTTVNIGFEPQWLLLKCTTDHNTNFKICDCMRGVAFEADDYFLNPNNLDAPDIDQYLDFTSTGFRLKTTNALFNKNNETYVFFAIRRSDGVVGKPAEAGTDVLAMDSGNSSTNGAYYTPCFDSGFPVDFAYYRHFTGSSTWFASARLTQKKYLQMCYQDDYENDSDFMFDGNLGWSKNGDDSSYKCWMWKRHAGFDVVTWDGNGSGNRAINHNLGQAPEMIWVKGTSNNDDWLVYNYYWVGSDQGSIRQDYGAPLNENASSNNISPQFGTTTPTATTFNVGWSSGKDKTNKNNEHYIAFLFAPVTGISALGSYTGTGAGDGSGPQITGLGFTPRFVLVRNASAGSWCQFDNTLTGLYLVRYNTIGTWLSGDYIEFVSGGFNIIKGPGGQINDVNTNNQKYIYFAHA